MVKNPVEGGNEPIRITPTMLKTPTAKEQTEKLKEGIEEALKYYHWDTKRADQSLRVNLMLQMKEQAKRTAVDAILQACKESGLMFVNHQLLAGHPYYQAIRHSIREIEI